MKEFILNNLSTILTCVTIVLSVILIIVKRRPTTIDEFAEAVDSIFEFLPSAISKVEHPGDGALKKEKVFNYAIGLIERFLGRSITEKERSIVSDRIDRFIESVLETPQKKGGKQ